MTDNNGYYDTTLTLCKRYHLFAAKHHLGGFYCLDTITFDFEIYTNSVCSIPDSIRVYNVTGIDSSYIIKRLFTANSKGEIYIPVTALDDNEHPTLFVNAHSCLCGNPPISNVPFQLTEMTTPPTIFQGITNSIGQICFPNLNQTGYQLEQLDTIPIYQTSDAEYAKAKIGFGWDCPAGLVFSLYDTTNNGHTISNRRSHNQIDIVYTPKPQKYSLKVVSITDTTVRLPRCF